MDNLLLRADAAVRGDLRLIGSLPTRRALGHLLVLILLYGAAYGAVMGSFGSLAGARWLQVVYSAIKVPLLLLATFALSLPSFFVFNTLYGVRSDFVVALRAVVASQAGLTVVLASLAPFTLLWNVSTTNHDAAVLFNALMFGTATAGGQVLLRRYYRPLLARDARHRALLRLWGLTYAFVGIQMGWILRPFVGDPDRPVAFFRADTWGNAYVIVAQMIRHLLK